MKLNVNRTSMIYASNEDDLPAEVNNWLVENSYNPSGIDNGDGIVIKADWKDSGNPLVKYVNSICGETYLGLFGGYQYICIVNEVIEDD